MHIQQPPQAIAALRRAVAALDADTLAGLGIAVPALGSLVLGLALAEQRLSAEQAYALACLDETFQIEQWGEDAEAAARRGRIAADIALAAQFVNLAGKSMAST
jgi:chaperone required for assembly of F1-ATPase